MKLVLQPCADADARRHYADTIENPVAISKILPHLRPEERDGVEAAFPDGVAVWGVTPGKGNVNANKWKRIALGDAALLYRDRRFFFRGTVAYRTHAPELARALWGSKADGTTWEYVFFLADLEPVEIDIARFNVAAGYAPNFVVQGFNVLDEESSEAIAEALDLGPGMGPTLPGRAEVSAAKRALEHLQGGLDIAASVRRRREQAHLRTILLGQRPSGHCSICSRELPINLLVIGHIRRRHSCTDEMRRDLANVMPVCVLGCDSLFEQGYIFVDESGTVRACPEAGAVATLTAALGAVVGQVCSAWNAGSEAYFAWHRRHPRKFV